MADFGAKIKPELAMELATKDERTHIGVIVHIASPLTLEQRERLTEAGAEINSEAGDVITCRASSEAIRAMTQLEFVLSLEGGKVNLF